MCSFFVVPLLHTHTLGGSKSDRKSGGWALWDTLSRMLQEAWMGMGIEEGSYKPTIILVCMMAMLLSVSARPKLGGV